MNIGEAIRTLRKQRLLSQIEIAEAAGITQAGISNIERALNRANDDTLQRIAVALNVAIVDIYLLAMEETDFPKEKRAKYRLIYPAVKALIYDITK